MDWTPISAAIVLGVAGLVAGWFAALKGAAPQWVAQKQVEQKAEFDQAIEKKKAELEAERATREAKIREEAEKAAYERNRAALREDRTLELLQSTLAWLQERSEKEFQQQGLTLEKFGKMIEGMSDLGNRYQNLYSAQTLTNQHLAVLTDTIRRVELRIVPQDGQE